LEGVGMAPDERSGQYAVDFSTTHKKIPGAPLEVARG